MARIAIIGLGLIGSSLGLSLKAAKETKPLEIVGFDKEPTVAGKARRIGSVDRTSWSLPGAVEGAQLVIIATPVKAIKEVMEGLVPHLTPGTVVTDTGSTKAAVMTWAEAILPKGVNFVGGHPMAGREVSGPDGASADLFRGAVYCIIPSKEASQEAVQTVVGMASTVGATPFFLDAKEHDSFVAAVSHLPIILSSALVSASAKSPSWREMAKLAATGFQDATRLASGDPEMNRDICLTNKESLIHWVNRYIEELLKYRALIEEEEKLLEVFKGVWEARERWLNWRKSGQLETPVEIPGMGERLSALFMGEKLARSLKKSMEHLEKPPEKR